MKFRLVLATIPVLGLGAWGLRSIVEGEGGSGEFASELVVAKGVARRRQRDLHSVGNEIVAVITKPVPAGGIGLTQVAFARTAKFKREQEKGAGRMRDLIIIKVQLLTFFPFDERTRARMRGKVHIENEALVKFRHMPKIVMTYTFLT